MRALKPPKELEPGKGNPEAIASAFPDSFQAQVALGEFLRKAGRIDEAFKVLERAAEMVPMATGPRSPHAMMAQMALERKDSARAISELEKLLQHENTDLDSVRLLARELEATQAPAARLMSAYERVAQLDPFDAANHSKLGRLKMQAGDAPHGRARVPRGDCRRVARSGVGACPISRKAIWLVGDKVQARRAGPRRHRSGAGVSARAGAAVEGGGPMIRRSRLRALRRTSPWRRVARSVSRPRRRARRRPKNGTR